MLKRSLTLILIVTFLFTLVGCGEVRDLTDEETTLIAEYAADVLLKHDYNYEDRIENGNKAAEQMKQTESTSEDATTQSQTEEVATEQATTEEKGNSVQNNIDEDSTEVATSDDKSIKTEGNVANLVGISGVNIGYKDYLIVDQYPATDAEGQFIYLEASEGYQLLVVRFEVSCTTEEPVTFSMMDKELDYRVVCNGTKAANPMLTILMNDLGTLETTVNPEENQEAVLIFQISNDMKDKLETIDLHVEYENIDNVITIL